ncbi:MAG TPA: hypothetical protein PLO23_06725 [Alphaproteobacteria bacterium]|nr:hypothetical protein [Alphaproteobacteria bacterium]
MSKEGFLQVTAASLFICAGGGLLALTDPTVLERQFTCASEDKTRKASVHGYSSKVSKLAFSEDWSQASEHSADWRALSKNFSYPDTPHDIAVGHAKAWCGNGTQPPEPAPYRAGG